MYEISLVPDVKAELLQKQKMRNLIIFICIIVAGICVGIILIMLGIIGSQSLTVSSQETEIACRTDGTAGGSGSSCSNYGSPIMTFKNVNELLTIQDQMKSIDALNSNKVKFSRVFGVLDVILPDGSVNGDKVSISSLTTDLSESRLSFEAIGQAENNIGFHVLESFRKGLDRTYFDYGDYMRKNEDGEYVAIPSFCITEYTEKGYTYAKYTKGEPGCEAPMVVSSSSSGEASNEKGNQTADGSEEGGEEEESESGEKKDSIKKETIIIRRTYDNSEDMENYKNGNDSKQKANGTKDSVSGYYFQSECMQYGDDGEFDEASTLETCPLMAEDGLLISGSSYGSGSDDEMVLTFSASLSLDPRVFKVGSKYMQIIGPSRQNVTDSYVEVRDMFTEKAKSLDEGEE